MEKPTLSSTIRDALALDAEAMFPPGSSAVFCVQASRSLLKTEHVEFVAKNGRYPIYRTKPAKPGV